MCVLAYRSNWVSSYKRAFGLGQALATIDCKSKVFVLNSKLKAMAFCAIFPSGELSCPWGISRFRATLLELKRQTKIAPHNKNKEVKKISQAPPTSFFNPPLGAKIEPASPAHRSMPPLSSFPRFFSPLFNKIVKKKIFIIALAGNTNEGQKKAKRSPIVLPKTKKTNILLFSQDKKCLGRKIKFLLIHQARARLKIKRGKEKRSRPASPMVTLSSFFKKKV